MRLLSLSFALALASCYSPDLADCTVACAADSECGGGQQCNAGMCAQPGIACTRVDDTVDALPMTSPEQDASVPDANPEPDASTPPPDGPPDPPPPPPPQTTTLRVKIKDQGRVTPSGHQSCAPNSECLYTVVVGQPITLEADPNPNRIFEKWEEACSGSSPSCTITPLAGPQTRVTAKFKKP